jgi:hypothetical protein
MMTMIKITASATPNDPSRPYRLAAASGRVGSSLAGRRLGFRSGSELGRDDQAFGRAFVD